MILEVCVDSVESAVNAEKGGADRIELCGDLIVGGITPSLALYERIREKTSLPIHVLLRPRFGDFLYSEEELEILIRQARMFAKAGADNLVIGCLTPDGRLDLEAMKKIIDVANGTPVNLHRAFDMCADPMKTFEKARSMGIDTILTSGQAPDCLAGSGLIADLVSLAGQDMTILVGAGVSAPVIEQMHRLTRAKAYHMSGKITMNSRMAFRRETVHMGLPGLSEYEIWQTGEENIRKAREVLDRLV